MFDIDIDLFQHILQTHWELMEEDIHNPINIEMVHYRNDMLMYYMYDHKHCYNYSLLFPSYIPLVSLKLNLNNVHVFLLFLHLRHFSVLQGWICLSEPSHVTCCLHWFVSFLHVRYRNRSPPSQVPLQFPHGLHSDHIGFFSISTKIILKNHAEK